MAFQFVMTLWESGRYLANGAMSRPSRSLCAGPRGEASTVCVRLSCACGPAVETAAGPHQLSEEWRHSHGEDMKSIKPFGCVTIGKFLRSIRPQNQEWGLLPIRRNRNLDRSTFDVGTLPQLQSHPRDPSVWTGTLNNRRLEQILFKNCHFEVTFKYCLLQCRVSKNVFKMLEKESFLWSCWTKSVSCNGFSEQLFSLFWIAMGISRKQISDLCYFMMEAIEFY